MAALTAISMLVIADVAARFAAHAWPSIGEVSIVAPHEVAIPLPALTESGGSLISAIVLSAAAALAAFALKKWAAPITITIVFFAMLDPSASVQQAPAMILRSLVLALLVWVVARYVLGRNPLAWPLFIFIGLVLQTALMLAQNRRPDLLANALGLAIIAAAAAVWAWRGNARVV